MASGVIGIVAGRVKDKFHRPSFVIALDENGLGKGSARSISGIDVGRLIAGAVDRGLIEAGGGHAMAAGLTLRAEQMAGFEAYLTEQRYALALDGPRDLWLDATLSPAAANTDLLELIQKAGPLVPEIPNPALFFQRSGLCNLILLATGMCAVFLLVAKAGGLKPLLFRVCRRAFARFLPSRHQLCHIAGFCGPIIGMAVMMCN